MATKASPILNGGSSSIWHYFTRIMKFHAVLGSFTDLSRLRGLAKAVPGWVLIKGVKTLMELTLSLRMNECVRKSEVRVKLARYWLSVEK